VRGARSPRRGRWSRGAADTAAASTRDENEPEGEFAMEATPDAPKRYRPAQSSNHGITLRNAAKRTIPGSGWAATAGRWSRATADAYASSSGRRQTALTSCAEIHTAPPPTITAPLPEGGP
jgi:hypothetical protein